MLWFWPNVDAGSDGTSKGIRVFREQEKPGQLPPFRNMSRRTSCGCSSTRGHRRQLQRGDPRVLVPRRAGGEHRLAPAGRERGANVIDVEHDRDAIADADPGAPAPRQDPAPTTSTATAAPARDRRLSGDGAADGREAADLLRLDDQILSCTTSPNAQRIAALGYDYAAQPRDVVDGCNLCGGDALRRAHAPRPVRLSARRRRVRRAAWCSSTRG